jgi:hypothetical protein
MRIRVQVLIESDQEAAPLHVEEVACLEREQLTPETLGLRLEEAKQMLASVQQVMTGSQVEAYVEQQRQCSHCQQPLAYKGHHQIGVRSLFGKLTLSSPRLYICSCQPRKTRSWSPVATLFSARSTPELLCQEVTWASLLCYGVTLKLLGDLLPMEHQLSASTLSRHVQEISLRSVGVLKTPSNALASADSLSSYQHCSRRPPMFIRWPNAFKASRVTSRSRLSRFVLLSGTSSLNQQHHSWSVLMAGTFMPVQKNAAKMGHVR